MRSITPFIVFAFSFGSCVDIYRIDLGDPPQVLVVDGIFTDGEGPFRLSVSRLDSTLSGSHPVEGVSAELIDDRGNSSVLFPEEPGKYVGYPTDDFSGQIGRSYFLRFETPDGQVYESFPQEMLPVPEVDTVYFERKDITLVRTGTGNEIDTKRIALNARFRTLTEGKTNIFFRYRGVFVVITPLPCNNCPTVCWIRDEPRDYLNIFSEQSSGSVPIEINIRDFVQDGKFSTRYTLELRQYSISDDAYQYLAAIEEQRSASGSIFDTPPVIKRGNIRNIGNPEEEVYGYFLVSAHTDNNTEISITVLRELGFPDEGLFPRCGVTVPPANCTNCLFIYPELESSVNPLEIEW